MLFHPIVELIARVPGSAVTGLLCCHRFYCTYIAAANVSSVELIVRDSC